MIIQGPIKLVTGGVWMAPIEIEGLPAWFTPRFYERLNAEPGYTKPHCVDFDGELTLEQGQ